MVTCTNCGYEVDDALNFCPRCGRATKNPAVERMIQDALGRLNQHPGDSVARYNLAHAYKLLNLKDLALREFIQVAGEQSDFADVHYEIAALHAEGGSTQEALAAVERALAIEPEHPKARRLLDRLRSRTSA
jgi:tetratricopeptide (TPR) repeat protein